MDGDLSARVSHPWPYTRLAQRWRHALAAIVALAIIVSLVGIGLRLHASQGHQTSFILVGGALFGFVAQRSRFCFFCMLREWLEEGDPRGVLGIVCALAVGTVGYAVLLGAWVPDPGAGYLPPRAHIGPVSWVVLAGGLLFGIGMSLSGSCISAHLYRLGEGSVLSVFALVGTVAGFILGFRVWNHLWSAAVAEAPVPWLPETLGYGGAVVLQLLVLGAIAVWLLGRLPARGAAPEHPEPNGPYVLWQRVMVRRWPAWLGGAAVGLIGSMMYLRAQPLGVTAELSRHARDLGNSLHLLPERLEGLDRLAGCIITITTDRIGHNGIFVLAMIGAALASALLADQFRPQAKSARQAVAAVLGGVLLGFGAMVALGCSIGTLLSGIFAFAVSGWLFALAMVFGVWISLPLHRWLRAP